MSAQTATVAAVARRGYLNGWNDDELLARQVVKLAEELGELANMLVASDLLLDSFLARWLRLVWMPESYSTMLVISLALSALRRRRPSRN